MASGLYVFWPAGGVTAASGVACRDRLYAGTLYEGRRPWGPQLARPRC